MRHFFLILIFGVLGCESHVPIARVDGSTRTDGGSCNGVGESCPCCTGLVCDSATSRCVGPRTDGGDGCPADIFAAEGMTCTTEGQFCGECTDPCMFCNLIRCQGGVWTRMEVFPKPCEDGGMSEVDAGSCAGNGESCTGAACCEGLVCVDSGPAGSFCRLPIMRGGVCDPAASACGPGDTCCYPCGIPDCDYVCEETCAPGTPGCFDGCFLRP